MLKSKVACLAASLLTPPMVEASNTLSFQFSWRLHHQVCHTTKAVDLQSSRLINDAFLGLTFSSSPISPSLSPAESATDPLSPFVSTFDPSKAGICLLFHERLKKHRSQHVCKSLSVSINLRDCYSSMMVLLFDQFAFPVMFDYTFSSIGRPLTFLSSWTPVLLGDQSLL